jgi:hypothetical protein
MMKKLLASAVLVGAAVVTLTGCSAPYATTPDAPVTTNTGDDPNGRGYNEEYVKLKDGSVIRCLWFNKNGTTGSMSCDWNDVQKK